MGLATVPARRKNMRLVYSPDDGGFYWWRSCYDDDNNIRFEVSKKVYESESVAKLAADKREIEWEEE